MIETIYWELATKPGRVRCASKTEASDEFQHPAPDVPKLIALPSLLHAAPLLHAANVVSRNDPDDLDAIKVLLDAGTGSLGGARPKASVRDGDRLMIAKFPDHADEWSVIA
jgi:serine/threonine-protein kinase HipA